MKEEKRGCCGFGRLRGARKKRVAEERNVCARVYFVFCGCGICF